MIEIALRRGLSEVVASSRVTTREQGKTDRGWRDKSADARRADMAGGVGEVGPLTKSTADVFSETSSQSTFPAPSLFPSPWRTR
jgi:hypothetical protein